MSDGDLLPPNATAQERALSMAAGRLSAVPVPIRDLWNPDTCPPGLLAWLAWAFGVDEWSSDWSEESKRATIRDAVAVQSRKGTVWSIRRVLANAGYGTATLYEGLSNNTYNGASTYNGLITYGDPSEWASYRAFLDRPMSNAQAAQVRRLLLTTAPARCQLVELDYTEVTNTYNGAIRYDGAYNHGTA